MTRIKCLSVKSAKSAVKNIQETGSNYSPGRLWLGRLDSSLPGKRLVEYRGALYQPPALELRRDRWHDAEDED